jgi:hypothetical protein
MWHCVAKFQTGLGSSPATYGLTAFLVTTAPAACTCVAGGTYVPPWLMLSLVPLLPEIWRHVPAYELQWWPGDARDYKASPRHDIPVNVRCVIFVGATLTLFWLLAAPLRQGLHHPCQVAAIMGDSGGSHHQTELRGDALPAWLFACVYLAITALYSPVLRAVLMHPRLAPSKGNGSSGRRHVSAYESAVELWALCARVLRACTGPPYLFRRHAGGDDRSHLGGTLGGVLIAILYRGADRTSSMMPHDAVSSAPLVTVALMACFALLVLRCWPCDDKWGGNEVD